MPETFSRVKARGKTEEHGAEELADRWNIRSWEPADFHHNCWIMADAVPTFVQFEEPL